MGWYFSGMARALRAAAGGMIYHVLNRANARRPFFDQPADFDSFEQVLSEAQKEHRVPLLAFCLMPNHWHLILAPIKDGDLSRFTAWLTLTHTQRWHAVHGTRGSGHLYQGRFKSFPVEEDEHFLMVCRYVERNALRAGLVARAEKWRWSSLWRRAHSQSEPSIVLADWPVRRPSNWAEWVNAPQTTFEEEAVRRCMRRGQPLGSDQWVQEIVQRFGLGSTMHKRGRPKKIRASAAWLPFAENGENGA
jgi:putative transposase